MITLSILTGINTTPENYLYSDYFNMDLKSIVNYQSKISTTSTDKEDYFRQVFANDYNSYLVPNAEMGFKRNNDNADISINKDEGTIGYKQESYEFIETTDFKNYYNFTFPEEFNVFDRETGKLLVPAIDYEIITTDNKISGITIKGNSITKIEVIPNFDNQRRIRISFKGYSGNITEEFLHRVLRQAKLYRWNASDLKINVYKNGFLSELNGTVNVDDIITVMVIDRLESDIDTSISDSDAGVTIIHENMNLPSSVNYTNPYTNSYKDDDEKEWKNDEPVYIYENDTFSNIYFETNSKKTDIHNGETDGIIKNTGTEYSNLVKTRQTEINTRTKQLRSNLYEIMKNSSSIPQTNVPDNKIINVDKNTEFVVIAATAAAELEIKIPEISTEYIFSINRVGDSGHTFVILPIWSKLETATIEIITSESNMKYRKMEATVV